MILKNLLGLPRVHQMKLGVQNSEQIDYHISYFEELLEIGGFALQRFEATSKAKNALKTYDKYAHRVYAYHNHDIIHAQFWLLIRTRWINPNQFICLFILQSL